MAAESRWTGVGTPPINIATKGGAGAYAGAVLLDGSSVANPVWLLIASGTPTDGVNGTATWSGAGSLYIDTSAGKIYINGGPTGDPDWDIITSA